MIRAGRNPRPFWFQFAIIVNRKPQKAVASNGDGLFGDYDYNYNYNYNYDYDYNYDFRNFISIPPHVIRHTSHVIKQTNGGKIGKVFI